MYFILPDVSALQNRKDETEPYGFTCHVSADGSHINGPVRHCGLNLGYDITCASGSPNLFLNINSPLPVLWLKPGVVIGFPLPHIPGLPISKSC